MDTSWGFPGESTCIQPELSFFASVFIICFHFVKSPLNQDIWWVKILHYAHTACLKTVCYFLLIADWSPSICSLSYLNVSGRCRRNPLPNRVFCSVQKLLPSGISLQPYSQSRRLLSYRPFPAERKNVNGEPPYRTTSRPRSVRRQAVRRLCE